MKTITAYLFSLVLFSSSASVLGPTHFAEKTTTPAGEEAAVYLPSKAARTSSSEPEPTRTKAVVVGVSHYQDADMPDLKLAHHDAEAFAAFLMSEGGGRLSQSDIILLTNEEATSARFAAALDWLFEQPTDGLCIVYFAGYGAVRPDSKQFPGYFLMNDSPLSPITTGAFNFPAYFGYHTNKTKRKCFIVANTYPLILPDEALPNSPPLNYRPAKLELKTNMSKNLVTKELWEQSSTEIGKSKVSLNNLLLDGLLGLADKNNNGEVTMRELGNFIENRSALPETWPSQLTMSYTNPNMVAGNVNQALLKKLSLHSDGMLPSIVHLESTRMENELLRQMGEREVQFYQDFVIAIKLGHLLEPSDRCAVGLLDSILQMETMQPFHGNFRRKLAAALQDEVQLALNAYLRSDIREIQNRYDDARYKLYPLYLEKAAMLLGERHYLYRITTVKKLYFQGLLYRLEAEGKHDTAMLKLALETQEQAVQLEPEAAFAINEMGVIFNRLGQLEASVTQFKRAAELAPDWSMPHNNLCHAMRQLHQYQDATQHCKKAIQLSQRNVMAINNHGLVQMELGQDAAAEKTFLRAISIDPTYPESYFNIAVLKASQGQHDIALEWLRQAFQKGFDDKDALMNNQKLMAVRELPDFEGMLLSFFPEK